MRPAPGFPRALCLSRDVYQQNSGVTRRGNGFLCPGRSAADTVRCCAGAPHCARCLWVPALRRTAKEALRRVRDTNQRSRGAMRPSFCNHLSLNVEGAGKAGCLLHPQPGVRKMKAHQHSHHRFNRVIPAFPARVVLTVSFVLSPATWLCCHRHRRAMQSIVANLTPALVCQNHTTSPSARSVIRLMT